MHILITNDDGVFSPGIKTLAEELQKIAQVTVIAPDRNWSATSHYRTINEPLTVNEFTFFKGLTVYTTNGSPSDCVALGLRGFLDQEVDLVVTGINNAANLGTDVTYSGTVNAALEALIWDTPAIAMSVDIPRKKYVDEDFYTAAKTARHIVEIVQQNGFPNGVIFNVNVPNLPENRIQGFRTTRLGRRLYNDRVHKRVNPRGDDYCWVQGQHHERVVEEGTDIEAVTEGFVSITPVRLDMTAYPVLSELQRWDWDEKSIQIEKPAELIKKQ